MHIQKFILNEGQIFYPSLALEVIFFLITCLFFKNGAFPPLHLLSQMLLKGAVLRLFYKKQFNYPYKINCLIKHNDEPFSLDKLEK